MKRGQRKGSPPVAGNAAGDPVPNPPSPSGEASFTVNAQRPSSPVHAVGQSSPPPQDNIDMKPAVNGSAEDQENAQDALEPNSAGRRKDSDDAPQTNGRDHRDQDVEMGDGSPTDGDALGFTAVNR